MPGSPAPLAIVGVAVVDGGGSPAVPGRTVVAGGIVQAVGPAGQVLPPAGALVVDGGGGLLPGFIDAHVHLGFSSAARVLAGGVTTVRDGWPAGRLAALRQGAEVPGASPRLLAAGQIVTVPGGYPTRAPWAPPGTARPVEGAAEAVAAVAELAEAGAAVIKVALDDRVGPTLPAVLAALVKAAGERGLGVTPRRLRRRAAKALAAGVGELAHWPFDPAGLPDALVDALAESVVAVPTLHIEPLHYERAGMRRFVAAAGGPLRDRPGQPGPPRRSTSRSWLCWSRPACTRSRRWPPPPRWPRTTWGWPAPARSRPGPGRISCWSTATRWPTCGPSPA